MQSSLSRRSLLNYVGIAILVAGLGSGEFIYWRSLQRGADSRAGDDTILREEDSKEYDHVVETQVGTFGAIMLQWNRALAKLGEPGPLAITICAVSLVAAAGCFFAASRIPRG